MSRLRLLSLLILGMTIWVQEGARGQETAQSHTLSPAMELAIERRMLDEFARQKLDTADAELYKRVSELGRRMVPVSDRPQLLYDFRVVKGRELQAYSFPGGTLAFPEALVRLFADKDELAFAIAHEMAHAALRHHASRWRWNLLLQEERLAPKRLLATVKSLFDREAELEADHYGALYAVRAGFRFTAALAALERLAKASPGPQADPAHPPYSERIGALRHFGSELEKAAALFKKGVGALEAGKAGEAIEAFSLFVGEFPNSHAGRLNLGAAYLARVRARSGTPGGLAEVLPILPEIDLALRLREPLDREDIYRAQRQFLEALRLPHPRDMLARAALGLVYIRLQETNEARRVLQEALEAHPQNAELLLALGNVEYMAAQFPTAELRYRAALEARGPNWPEARKNLALTLEKKGDRDEALRAWKTIIDSPRFGEEAREHVESLTAPVGAKRDAPEDGGR